MLLSALIPGETKDDCAKILDTLIHHVEKHFHDEEEIFRSSNYDGADQHTIIHNELVGRSIKLAEKYKNDSLSLGEVFVFLASEVVHNHMIVEDKKFFKYL